MLKMALLEIPLSYRRQLELRLIYYALSVSLHLSKQRRWLKAVSMLKVNIPNLLLRSVSLCFLKKKVVLPDKLKRKKKRLKKKSSMLKITGSVFSVEIKSVTMVTDRKRHISLLSSQ
jgi:hypothetical protein